MDSSIVLGQILGVVIFVVGLEMVLQRKFVSAALEAALQNPAIMWTMGLLALILGATMVSLENSWSYSWTLIITIIGWAAILKGILILLFPEWSRKLYHKAKNPTYLATAGIIAIVVGLILLWVSPSL